MLKKAVPIIPKLAPGEVYPLNTDVPGIQLSIEWVNAGTIICDLDLTVCLYDERARMCEKLTMDHPNSNDGGIFLQSGAQSFVDLDSQVEHVRINFSNISRNISSMLLFLDGGPRNFQFVQQLIMHCDEIESFADSSSFFVSRSIDKKPHIFNIIGRNRRDCQGVVLCIVYKEFQNNGSHTWVVKSLLEPVHVPTLRQKDERCNQVAILQVPSLDKYRPRLFDNIKTICAMLSSKSLPLLKESFEGPGLLIIPFVETIFKQLFQQCPQLQDQREAEYLVALLHELFGQIDLDGNGSVDWDEFTLFTISSIASIVSSDGGGDDSGARNISLDDYVIEYTQDTLNESSLHFVGAVLGVHYVPSTRRIIIIENDSDNVVVSNDRGQSLYKFSPCKAEINVLVSTQESKYDHPNAEREIVYDCIYLSGRDLFAYCSSVHTIGIYKELITAASNKRPKFTIHNKIIFSNLLHLLLCWSEKTGVLCSVASNNNIYGWNIDTGAQLFNVSRHSDIIKGFLALDDKDLYATCSLDKRIVLWSQETRRVKGILLGHKRGVRTISVVKNTMLSAGFETEARTWDLTLKEQVLTLSGHRYSILSAQIMCDPLKGLEEDMRAVTCDESGEIRLWNIFVKERSADVMLAPVIQIFSMFTSEPPLNQFTTLIFPYAPDLTKACYSNILAVSTKIIGFTAEKNAREFVAPTCSIFNDSTSCLVTAVGKNLLKYDLATGSFFDCFSAVHSSDLTSLCFDNAMGRRLYVGCNNGDVLLLNFSNGAVLTVTQVHTQEVTSMFSLPATEKDSGSANILVTGSLDGRLRLIEEESGELNIKHTSENPFLDGSGVAQIKGINSMNLVVVSSVGTVWAIWNLTLFKRLMLLKEEFSILDIALISKKGSSRKKSKFGLLNVAVASPSSIHVYTLDPYKNCAVRTYTLELPANIYITTITVLHCSDKSTINYSLSRNNDNILGSYLIAVTDDGNVAHWSVDEVINSSCEMFFQEYPPEDRTRRRASSEAPFSPGGRDVASPVESRIGTAASNSSLVTDGSMSPDAIGFDLFSPLRADMVSPTITTCDKSVELFQPLAFVQPVTINTFFCSMNLMWKAHDDCIIAVIPLHNDGCLISVSLDGFHRVWNVDMECLGEMMMTNLTEEMKERTLMAGYEQSWKFIQERIPVSDAHKEIAKRLLRILNGLEIEISLPELNISKRRESQLPSISPIKSSVKLSDDMQSKASLRSEKLFELMSPCVVIREDFCEDGVSLTESHLQKISENYIKPIAGDDGSVGSMESENYGSVGSSVSSITMSISPTKQPKPLWIKLGNGHNSIPPAFSEASLSASHSAGLIDGEGHQILRHLSKQEGKIAAYELVTSPIFVRNTSLSTSIVVPSIKNIQLSEVYLGPQKSKYKNAAKEYERRVTKGNNLKKAHHAITVRRIEKNVRDMGSMIHISDRKIPTEVIVPDEDNTGITEEALRRLPNRMMTRGAHRDATAESYNPNSEDAITTGEGVYRTLSLSSGVDGEPSINPLTSDAEAANQTVLSHPKRIPFSPVHSFSSDRSNDQHLSVASSNVSTDSKLNHKKINSLMNKIDEAMHEDNIPEWEKRSSARKNVLRHNKKLRTLEAAAVVKMQSLEKRLGEAMKHVFRVMKSKYVEEKAAPPKALTNRNLLPYYQVSDVQNFLSSYYNADDDFSGDLDPEEWTKFFTQYNRSISKNEAQVMFLKLDTNNCGVISMRDVVPLVFDKATASQKKAILYYCESEVMKSKFKDNEVFSATDLESLFDFYDTDVIGFVSISTIKERITTFKLPPETEAFVLGPMSTMADDDMLSPVEFEKLMNIYLAKVKFEGAHKHIREEL